jgi:hypothetical protein
MAPAVSSPDAVPAWLRKTGIVLLVLWAVVFVLGAIGELFGIGFLREITDFKRIFLR